MEELQIKITGGGTVKDVCSALTLIAKQLTLLNTGVYAKEAIQELDGSEWEDCTLLTEISVEL